MALLQVSAQGVVSNAEEYFGRRRVEVAARLTQLLSTSGVARLWLADCTLATLTDAEGNYDGCAATRAEAEAALAAMAATRSAEEIVARTEDFLLHFCGFSTTTPKRTRYLSNGLHFQFEMSVAALVSLELPLPEDTDSAPQAVKTLFDDASICSAELLLRSITEDGVANPFSPGQPMGKLLKLPLFAQCVLVLINAVEAAWYQAELPGIPLAINVYASLMGADAPFAELVGNAPVIEVMELTKGCKRGDSVVAAANSLRAQGRVVLLDDFDAAHPAAGANASGIKVSVFANAFHSLQAWKNVAAGGAALLPFAAAATETGKARPQPFDVIDYYGQIIPAYQPTTSLIIMEGSENCLKSEVSPGPPLNFGQANAAVASAHVFKLAALTVASLTAEGEVPRLVHQGGRALYANESFDVEAQQVIAAVQKPLPAARAGDAGTMCWLGSEGLRRAAMASRLPVCGIVAEHVQMAVPPVAAV